MLRWVSAESGLLGIVIATLAGTVCPGGPITMFPIAAAFLAVGANVGAAIAFVTSWTLLGYGRTLVWELPFFGAEFVIWRRYRLFAVAGRRRACWRASSWAGPLAGRRTGRRSMILFVDALLFFIAPGWALMAASRGRACCVTARAKARSIASGCMPRIMLGVIGAGYIAALLPQEVVGRWLGGDSGVAGLCIAVLGGAFTPGGPVIGFSIGAAAIKGGAGVPQVIAYTRPGRCSPCSGCSSGRSR